MNQGGSFFSQQQQHHPLDNNSSIGHLAGSQFPQLAPVCIGDTAHPSDRVFPTFHQVGSSTGGMPYFPAVQHPLPAGMAINSNSAIVDGGDNTNFTYTFPTIAASTSSIIGLRQQGYQPAIASHPAPRTMVIVPAAVRHLLTGSGNSNSVANVTSLDQLAFASGGVCTSSMPLNESLSLVASSTHQTDKLLQGTGQNNQYATMLPEDSHERSAISNGNKVQQNVTQRPVLILPKPPRFDGSDERKRRLDYCDSRGIKLEDVMSAPPTSENDECNSSPPDPSPSPNPPHPVEEDERVDIHIRNVVVMFSVKCHLDLRLLALSSANCVFERSKGCAMKQIRNPTCFIKIWAQGKVIITGCKSEEDGKRASKKVARALRQIFSKVRSIHQFRVTNIMATCKLPFEVKVVDIAKEYPKEASYEPELQTGLLWRSLDPKATIRIHPNGSCTVTGAKSTEAVATVMENLWPIFEKHRNFNSGRVPKRIVQPPTTSLSTVSGSSRSQSTKRQRGAGRVRQKFGSNLSNSPNMTVNSRNKNSAFIAEDDSDSEGDDSSSSSDSNDFNRRQSATVGVAKSSDVDRGSSLNNKNGLVVGNSCVNGPSYGRELFAEENILESYSVATNVGRTPPSAARISTNSKNHSNNSYINNHSNDPDYDEDDDDDDDDDDDYDMEEVDELG